MSKNYLLIYSEQLATKTEFLCQNTKAHSNTLFQIRKSSSSVYANIREANYGQSKADMLYTSSITEDTYKVHRNLCGRIRRMLIASCKTLKENAE